MGHPAGVSRISGLAFDLTGNLFGTTEGSGGFPPPPGPMTTSSLIQINPATGALIGAAKQVKDSNGNALSIADLAVSPLTGALYGIRGPNDGGNGQGDLYTISTTTGVATFVGATGDFFGSIAFAPNGTLYMVAADLDMMGNQINIGLKTLSPATAATLSFVSTHDYFGALGIRPTDGAIFGGTGDTGNIDIINPLTGAETLVGNTGTQFVGDIAFQTPEPGTLALLGIGLFVIARRASRSKISS